MSRAARLIILGSSYLVLGVYWRSWGWLLAWMGGAFMAVGWAYARSWPGLFAKRPDGSLPWWSALAFLPYLTLTWAVFELHRRTSREPCHNEIAPGLFLGRRCQAHELPPGVDLVADLTSEFPEPRPVRAGRAYVCAPALDAEAMAPADFRELVGTIAAWPGRAYVHCAMGHGRSAVVVAGVLLARKLARTPEEAAAAVQKARPGISLSAGQRRLLADFAASQRGPVRSG